MVQWFSKMEMRLVLTSFYIAQGILSTLFKISFY